MSSSPADVTEYRPSFNGNASAYFRIWITNIFLSVITLGIYSARAKVRTQRYFLGNTELAGATFDYTGDPLKILIGRLIIGFIFVTQYLLTSFAPQLIFVSAAIGILLLPWMIVNALNFNLQNTVYRGIRFGFDRNYTQAYKSYFIDGMALTVITLGLAAPYAVTKYYGFLASHFRFGKTHAKSEMSVGEAYKIVFFWLAAFIFITAVYIASGIIITMASHAQAVELLGQDNIIFLIVAYLFAFGIYAVIFGCMNAMTIQLRRAFWNKARLGQITFASTVDVPELLFILLTNAVAIVCSLGLLYPWAKVRKYNYMLKHMKVVVPSGALESFVQDNESDALTLGDASADLFGVGLEF